MQLVLDIVGLAARPRRVDHSKLPATFSPLGASLAELRKGYELVLQKRKQPSASIPDTDLSAQAAGKFTKALKALENDLVARIADSKSQAASRVSDAVSSLWDAFGAYTAAAAVERPDVAKLRSCFERIDEWVQELATQEPLL